MLTKGLVIAALALSSVAAYGKGMGNGSGQGRHGGQGTDHSTKGMHGGKGGGMAKRLGLTDDQKKQVDAIREEHRKKVQSGEASAEPGAMRDEIKKILTPEQQKLLPENPGPQNRQ
jgi:Spy/CpxP family protein refolding chaperone